jgi:hypothetical protein
MAGISQFPICSLCNEPVEVETAKTDEKGNAVHEDCYVLEMQPESTKYIAVSPMTLNCPRCGAKPGQVCGTLDGEAELIHVERIEAAAAMDVAARAPN